jgi:hypothetical protein
MEAELSDGTRMIGNFTPMNKTTVGKIVYPDGTYKKGTFVNKTLRKGKRNVTEGIIEEGGFNEEEDLIEGKSWRRA